MEKSQRERYDDLVRDAAKRQDECLRMREDGMIVSEIAEVMRVSTPRVYQLLQKAKARRAKGAA